MGGINKELLFRLDRFFLFVLYVEPVADDMQGNRAVIFEFELAEFNQLEVLIADEVHVVLTDF